jgi:steroid 5-alpha reductase family enzyme
VNVLWSLLLSLRALIVRIFMVCRRSLRLLVLAVVMRWLERRVRRLLILSLSLPFLALTRGPEGFGLLAILGAALAAFGIVFEAVADWQLERFKKGSRNHGRVLDTGLWRYSRHPNYFGECCVWWGFGLMALGTGAWWALASPLLMTVLLLKVSGVTLLERDIGERRPEYARYVRETNAFLPGPPRPAS